MPYKHSTSSFAFQAGAPPTPTAQTSALGLTAGMSPIVTALSEAAVADLFGVSVKTLRNRRATGDSPPYVRLSRSTVIYLVKDIQTFFESRRVNNLRAPRRSEETEK